MIFVAVVAAVAAVLSASASASTSTVAEVAGDSWLTDGADDVDRRRVDLYILEQKINPPSLLFLLSPSATIVENVWFRDATMRQTCPTRGGGTRDTVDV